MPKNRLLLIILGLILGILVYIAPSIILSLLLLWGIFAFIASKPQNEKRALTKLVIIALVMRFVVLSLSVFVLYWTTSEDMQKYPAISKVVGHSGQVVRDFGREIENGIRIARYLKGEFGDISIIEASVHGRGFLHAGCWVQGILNFIFGVSIFNLFLFPLIDIWTLIIIYSLAKILFDLRTAIFSSSVYAVMPSIIVTACTNIRFSLSIFSVSLLALFLVKFARTNSFRYLFIIAVATILFMIFRRKAATPLLAVLPLILLIAFNIKLKFKVAFLTLLIFLSAILFVRLPPMQYKFQTVVENIISSQVGFVRTADGNTYKIYDEFVYKYSDIKNIPKDVLLKTLPKGIIRGIVYFMFAPFPWRIINTSRLYIYPQLIFWYFVIPFALLGIIRALIFKTKGALPVIVLYGYFIILLSLVLGNVGIAVRFRDLISPFVYIFAGSVICKFIGHANYRRAVRNT